MLSIKQQLLSKVLSEISSIVIAVLFALWANSWWAERQRNIEVGVLSEQIVIELQDNLDRLKKSHEHHTEQLKLIVNYKNEHGELSEDDYIFLNDQLFKRSIFQPAELFFTYWEILIDKGLISELSNSNLSSIKPAYKAMRRYNQDWESNSGSSILITLLANTPKANLEITNQSIAQLWWSEKNAIHHVEKSLDKLGFKTISTNN